MDAEYTYAGDVGMGARGARARAAQEWLSLNGWSVAIDGEFGPASAAATRAFQHRHGLHVTGVVDQPTFERLVDPLINALAPLHPSATLSGMVVAYAMQHLAQHPREVGGQNRGPWVRLYMGGNEGTAWPWCAGFASYVMRQASATVGRALPFRTSYSCDLLAANATSCGCFCPGSAKLVPPERVRPGALFLTRRTVGDWEHVGIVINVEPDAFHSVEGNTNDGGDREGYEVCQRVRGYNNKDFVLLDV